MRPAGRRGYAMEVERECLHVSSSLQHNQRRDVHLYSVSCASEAALAHTSGVVDFEPEVAASRRDRPRPAKKILQRQQMSHSQWTRNKVD